LSAVYSSVLLFWLGDESEDHVDSWAFLDRRIENVMQFEKAKVAVRGNSFAKAILEGPLSFLGRIKAPSDDAPKDLPGQWRL
ncbi:MAG: COQ9 family protein, partial [Halocynthiibacter sp.]